MDEARKTELFMFELGKSSFVALAMLCDVTCQAQWKRVLMVVRLSAV